MILPQAPALWVKLNGYSELTEASINLRMATIGDATIVWIIDGKQHA
jgi:hypothetical protein